MLWAAYLQRWKITVILQHKEGIFDCLALWSNSTAKYCNYHANYVSDLMISKFTLQYKAELVYLQVPLTLPCGNGTCIQT